MVTAAKSEPDSRVCGVREGDTDTALPDHAIARNGGGGVAVIGPTPGRGPTSDNHPPLDGSARPRDVRKRSWRLVKPTGPEARALQAIRTRAGSALAGTSAAALASDLATTRTHAGRLLDRLALKGWIVSCSARVSWLPTSFAGLALRMADVEALVAAVAGLSLVPVPGVQRSVVKLARSLATDAGPSRGCMSHPTAHPGDSKPTHAQATAAGVRRFRALRREARGRLAVNRARQALAATSLVA